MRLSSSLKLRHLEVFVEVARKMSVTQAAEALGMTQPAVTRALRELEAVCGKPLVEKHGRGIRLSSYGELFRDHAGRSLALARDGVALLQGLGRRRGRRSPSGRCRPWPRIWCRTRWRSCAQAVLRGDLR